MSEELFHQDEPLSEVLQQVSSQLRLSLGNIHNALTRLAPPDLRDQRESVDRDAAALCQSYYRILRLTNNLSDASEPERTEGQGMDNDDIVGVCRTVMEQAAVPAELLGIRLEFRSAKASQIIAMDSGRVQRLLLNLLSNAMKFTKAGNRVSVTLRQMDEGKRNNYLFVVEDNGPGMSEEFLPKLFDPYEREVRFGAKEVTGTGLGMPIVKNLVTRMGGQIAVRSALGKGTTFSVTIPFDVGEMPAPVEEKSPQELVQLAGRHILLAEDNLLNMEIATELLKMRGAKVTQAEDGRKALEAFQESAPFSIDAILMDMQMPEMDGCESTRAIRALDRPDAKHVPIIALTANAFAEDITRTTQAGMNAHLAKPINIEQLCSVLTKLMSEHEQTRNKTERK